MTKISNYVAEIAEVLLRCENEGKEKGYIPFSLYIKLADSFVSFKRVVDESEYAKKIFEGSFFKSVEEILKTVEIGWKVSDIESGSLFQEEEESKKEEMGEIGEIGIGEISKQIRQWANVVGENIQDWRIMKDIENIQIACSSPLWNLFRSEKKEMILSSEIEKVRKQIEKMEKILLDENGSIFDEKVFEKIITEKAIEIESEITKKVLSEVEGKIAGVEENLFSKVKEEIREYINSEEGKSVLKKTVEEILEILEEKDRSGEYIDGGYIEESGGSGENYEECEIIKEKDVEDTIRKELESVNERVTLLEGRVDRLENMLEEVEEEEEKESIEDIEEEISEGEKTEIEQDGEVFSVEEIVGDIIEEVARNIEEGGRVREAVEKVVKEKISEVEGSEGEEVSIPEDIINAIKEDISYEVLSEVRRVLSSEVERVVEERIRDISIRLMEIEEKLEKKEIMHENSYKGKTEEKRGNQEKEETLEGEEEIEESREDEGTIEEEEEESFEDEEDDEEGKDKKGRKRGKSNLGNIVKRAIVILIPLILLFLILMKLF